MTDEYICEKCRDTGKVTIHCRKAQEFSEQRCPVCNGISVIARDRLAAVERERDELKELTTNGERLTAAQFKRVVAERDAALARAEKAEKRCEVLENVARLIGTIFVYGDFVAETYSERELESLLRELGFFWDSVREYEQSLADAGVVEEEDGRASA